MTSEVGRRKEDESVEDGEKRPSVQNAEVGAWRRKGRSERL
jgi:hypothetical protein